MFWVNVPVGVFGTVWAYHKLRETSERHPARIDWWGNVTFAVGLGAVLIAITYGIQPYGGHTMGWTNPWVLAGLIGGVALLAIFVAIERRVAEPMFQVGLFRIRAFAAGSVAGLLAATARGGLQFMLIIWLQGIWLPLHGYNFADTPLWAGIYLLPLTIAFLASGPISGYLSDRYGSRGFATAGMLVFASSFVGLLLLPVDFHYWAFALLILLNGIGVGMFAAPNSSSIMGSVPPSQRGAASGMRSTFQNTGTALSIGVFFSLMIAGLATNLPHTLTSGLIAQGVAPGVAHQIGSLPPVSSLFAAVLGVNPVAHLLGSSHVLATLPAANQAVLTGHQFFPQLISGPFHDGLMVVFIVAAGLSVLGALASLMRGDRYVPSRRPDPPTQGSHPMTDAAPAIDPRAHRAAGHGLPAGGRGMIDDSDALVARAARPSTSSAPAEATSAMSASPSPTPTFRTFPPPAAWARGSPRAPGLPRRFPHHPDRRAAGPARRRHHRPQDPGRRVLHHRPRPATGGPGVDTLILAGISTSGVVLSTVRDGADRDYALYVLSDATADRDATVHACLMEKVFPRQAEVISVAELEGILTAA